MAAHTDVVISRNRSENRFAIVFTLTEFAEASSRISVVGWLHEYLRCADGSIGQFVPGNAVDRAFDGHVGMLHIESVLASIGVVVDSLELGAA